MPIGTGVDTIHNVPAVPFSPNPGLFDQMTAKNHVHNISFGDPGSGGTIMRELNKAGIITWMTLVLEGTLTYNAGSGSITTSWRWPYGFLDNIAFAANMQNGLINCNGMDLHVLRFLTNPSFIDGTDSFSGTVGGGDAITGSSTMFVHLTFQIPVVMDRVTLAGAIYAQSNQNALTVTIKEATVSSTTAGVSMLNLTGNATATFAGTWTLGVDSYEIPQDPELGVITPDLSRLHGVQARETGFTSTGDITVPLTQVNGQLTRLLVQSRKSITAYINPKPQSTADWTNIKLIYGANQTPLDFTTAELVARNNENYGAPLPYGYVCLDFVRENAVRDAVFMPGLTDLKIVNTIDSSVTVTADGQTRVVQEMLFQ